MQIFTRRIFFGGCSDGGGVERPHVSITPWTWIFFRNRQYLYSPESIERGKVLLLLLECRYIRPPSRRSQFFRVNRSFALARKISLSMFTIQAGLEWCIPILAALLPKQKFFDLDRRTKSRITEMWMRFIRMDIFIRVFMKHEDDVNIINHNKYTCSKCWKARFRVTVNPFLI